MEDIDVLVLPMIGSCLVIDKTDCLVDLSHCGAL